MSVNLIRPSRNKATAASLAAFNTAGQVPPGGPLQRPGPGRGNVRDPAFQSRTGPGRAILHPDAETAQEKDHAADLEPGVFGVGKLSAQQAADGGVDQSADRNQLRHQHERLPELAADA